MVIAVSLTVLIISITVLYSLSLAVPGNDKRKLHQWIHGRQRKLLHKHFEYYSNLSESEKQEFLLRLNKIIKSKQFIGRGDIFVTTQMKILIAASITQLTFGFTKYLLPQYRTIFIYPDAYLNKQAQKLYKGETNTIGYICFSWKHFMEGYLIGNDRKNLGLHECAHALLNTIIYSNLHDPELDENLFALDKIPQEEKNRLFSGNDQFFRDYGRTNIKEFFAVGVECFFEAPERFKTEFPVFYGLMSHLLNQDPAGKIFSLSAPNNKASLKQA
jgi:Mlc titration factor MtfA (ptsG expression regulator)